MKTIPVVVPGGILHVTTPSGNQIHAMVLGPSDEPNTILVKSAEDSTKFVLHNVKCVYRD